MNIYATALEARTNWAMHRVSAVAGDDKKAIAHLRTALEYARRSGDAAGWAAEEVTCPALLIDVEQLRAAFMVSFDAVRERRELLRTRDGIAAELKSLAAESNRGCGLSYELFVKRFSIEADDLFDELEPEFKEMALELAKAIGYATADERERMQDEIEASGGCSLTGIDPWCCPCGRHE